MKLYKRIMSVVICCSLLFTSTVITSEACNVHKSNDAYTVQMQEKINVDGADIIYIYGYDGKNNKCIEVINKNTNEKDNVVYDEKLEQIFVDGELVASISDTLDNDSAVNENYGSRKAPAYKYLGSKTKRITWKKGVSVAVLAALVALAINGNVGAAAVIAKVGATALSVIAGSSINAVVTTKTYSRTAGKITNYKFVWTFKPNKHEKCGPYTIYATV